MNALLSSIFSRSDNVGVSICDDAFFFQKSASTAPLRIGAYIGRATSDGRILAVGDDVRDWDKHPQLEKVRVLESGVIVNDAGATEIFKKGFRQMFPNRILQPRPCVVVATSVSGDKARPLREAALYGGAREIFLIDSSMAALIALREADVQKPEPTAVLIVSNDWFVFAISSLSNIIASCHGRLGAEEIVEDIRIHCRQTRGFLPDENAIAAALFRHGFSGEISAEGWTTWLGKSGVGERTARNVDVECIRDGALPTILRISERVKTLLESLPVDTRGKLHASTIEATGCAMEIPGFSQMLENQLGIRIHNNAGKEQPTLTGAVRAITELRVLRKVTKTRYS